MKNRMFLLEWVVAVSMLMVTSAFGEDLLQVYNQALQNDPIFKQEDANWQAQKMNVPIARAGYLPQFTIQASGARKHTFIRPATLSTIYHYYWDYGYTATLSQPIFAISIWRSIKQADATVKAAAATYFGAQQDLMRRTVEAYFNVLKRKNTLYYVIARKNAIYKQWELAKETYHAGLIAITDVYDAEARYDVAQAQEITARNNVDTALEKLRAITGHYYTQLYGLKNSIPLYVPQPNNIDAWTAAAEKENYNIQSQNFSVIAAMDNIKKISTQDWPVISATSSYAQTQNAANNGNKTTNDTAALGFNLTYQPIQGGLITASAQQAKYNYVAASDRLEETHRQVVESVRSNYLNVISGIDKIKFDRISILSAEKALDATTEGLRVGTRTMIDVLADLNNLYQNKQEYVDDQYSYLNYVILLKNASSRLSVSDLAKINQDLKSKIIL